VCVHAQPYFGMHLHRRTLCNYVTPEQGHMQLIKGRCLHLRHACNHTRRNKSSGICSHALATRSTNSKNSSRSRSSRISRTGYFFVKRNITVEVASSNSTPFSSFFQISRSASHSNCTVGKNPGFKRQEKMSCILGRLAVCSLCW
jgi:hypothetical protein